MRIGPAPPLEIDLANDLPTRSEQQASRWSPEFTNEVQHQFMVVPWDRITDIFHWKSAVRLPAYRPKGIRSGKSLQLWIAR